MKSLFKLDELDARMSELNQLKGNKLIWALNPVMLALIQHNFLEKPCEGVRLPIAFSLSNIMKLATPISPYNDDFMRSVFRLIVETLSGLG